MEVIDRRWEEAKTNAASSTLCMDNINYAQSRLEYLFEKFASSGHILRQYPLATIVHFLLIATATALNPVYVPVTTEAVLRRLRETVHAFAEEFLTARVKGIQLEYIGMDEREAVIVDRPWRGTSGYSKEIIGQHPGMHTVKLTILKKPDAFVKYSSDLAATDSYVHLLCSEYVQKFRSMFNVRVQVQDTVIRIN